MAHTTTSETRTRPPGPPHQSLLGCAPAIRRDARGFSEEMWRCYGDIVRLRFLLQPAFFLFHPEAVQHVLQMKHQNYDKNVSIIQAMRVLLGNSIFTSNGDFWRSQRRLMQPAFHHRHIAACGDLMLQETLQMLDRWQASSSPLDIQAELIELSLHIVVKALIGDFEADALSKQFAVILPLIADYIKFPIPPLTIPTKRNRQLQRGIREVNALLDKIIASCKKDTEQSHLLTLLLATDETGHGMSDQQLRDEILTLILGGYETTALTLSWTWYLLSQHPEVEEKLHTELDHVLGGRTPTSSDLSNLPYTRMVLEETLRLYPPSPALVRHACDDDCIDGYHIPKGSIIFLFPHITHRYPAIWEEPEVFDPERFTPERSAGRPRFAYFPFGGGPRLCIGNSFAMMEGQLVLATIAQRFRLRLIPDVPIESEELTTVRMKQLPMTLQRRF